MAFVSILSELFSGQVTQVERLASDLYISRVVENRISEESVRIPIKEAEAQLPGSMVFFINYTNKLARESGGEWKY